jgi:serum/glucocorticoid-regulated kinase 2
LLCKDTEKRIGRSGGLLEILDHKWFSNVDLIKFLFRKVKPPFIPDPLKPPALLKEFKEGDLELIRKLLDKNGTGT